MRNKIDTKSVNPASGFTLIELLVALVIIGVLAAFAMPSYQRYVQKTHRADAQRVLLEIRQALERGYSTSYNYAKSYTASSDAATVSFSNAAPAPSFYPASNLPSNYYTITGSGTTSTYTLTAAPISTQATDECGTLTINQSGQKTPANTTTQSCW